MKVCKGCLISKQEKEFYYCKNTKDKLMSKCISCNKLYMTKYYKKNTQIIKNNSLTYKVNNLNKYIDYNKVYRKTNYHIARNRRLKSMYGITLEQFNILSEKQNHLCAICGNPQIQNRRHNNEKTPLAVDHCHSTNKIRELLCSNCNGALGLFKDNITVMNKAIEYIKKHKEK